MVDICVLTELIDACMHACMHVLLLDCPETQWRCLIPPVVFNEYQCVSTKLCDENKNENENKNESEHKNENENKNESENKNEHENKNES